MASGCAATTVTNSGSGLSEGFQPSFDALTLNSTATGVEDVGLLGVQPGCVVRGCTFVLGGAATGTGISISTASAVVEDNTVRSCNTGINVSGANGLVVHNRVTTCTTKINASATSQTGPLINATGAIASTNPWANFTD
jgi:nitrous oxidase accessory protein NosD